jgi:hypothetical protein
MAGPVIGGAQFAPSLVAVFDLAPMNQGVQYPMEIVVGYPTYRQADWPFDVPADGCARVVPSYAAYIPPIYGVIGHKIGSS